MTTKFLTPLSDIKSTTFFTLDTRLLDVNWCTVTM